MKIPFSKQYLFASILFLVLTKCIAGTALPQKSIQNYHENPSNFQFHSFPENSSLKTFSFSKRLLISESILTATSTPALYGLVISSSGWSSLKYFVSYKQFSDSWTKPPVWDYDAPVFNYAVHPYMGSMIYLASRDRNGSMLESFLISAAGSFTFEYVIESFSQQPSINDLILTPVLGAAFGEVSFQLIRKMKSDGHFSTSEKVAVTLLDPVNVILNGFHFSRLEK